MGAACAAKGGTDDQVPLKALSFVAGASEYEMVKGSTQYPITVSIALIAIAMTFPTPDSSRVFRSTFNADVTTVHIIS